MRCVTILGLSALLCGVAAAGEKSVTIGPTYDIVEPDTLAEIKKRAGEVDWQAWMSKRAPEDFSAFQSVPLPFAKEDRSRLFDPTYTLPRDIVDGRGGVLWPAGTQINVYERISTTARTIVIGDDPAHFEWLRDVAQPGAGDRVYLAGGNVLVQMRARERRFYLLEDRVIERFGLRAVPAIVQQEGNQLRVSEYALGDH